MRDAVQNHRSKSKNGILNRQPSDYHFAISIPSYWDSRIKEELIRPLFIDAGLINNDDRLERLHIFDQAKSTFRYIQSPSYNYNSTKLKSHIGVGKQCILCIFDLKPGNICLTLTAFKSQYPSLTSIDRYNVAQVIKSIRFKMKEKDGGYTSM